MTVHVQRSSRSHMSFGAIIAAILAAGLMSSAAVGTAEAANKGAGVKAPAPKAAVVTTQGKFDRGQVRPADLPTKATYDKACQRSGHRPRYCFPHSH